MKVLAILALFFAVSLCQVSPRVQRALQFQREISKDSTIDLISAPCAHNAYNNPWNLPPLVISYQNLAIFEGQVILQNQDYNMTDLLEYGIRHLQIDVHYIPEYNDTLMCHGASEALDLCPVVEAFTADTCKNSIGFEDLGTHTGCTQDAVSWRNGLEIIRNFVAMHTDEFFYIEIENQVDYSNISRLFDPLNELFEPFALTQNLLDEWRANNTGKQWPTLNELLALGKNVIIGVDAVTEGGLDIDLQPSISFPSNQAKYFDLPTCKSTQSPNTGTSFSYFAESDIMVIFDILGLYSNSSGHVDVGAIAKETGLQIHGCGYATCLDRITPQSMDAFVWSWESGKNDIACQSGLCAVIGPNGWTHVSCTTAYSHACQSETDPLLWQLDTSSEWSTNSCGSGFKFSFPKNPTENRELKKLSGSSNVWLNIPLQFLPNSTSCAEEIETSISSKISPYGTLFASLAAVFAFFALM